MGRLALVCAVNAAAPPGPSEAQERIRAKARELGANAVVVTRDDDELGEMTGTALVYRN